ncbi:MAG: hypothetical protein JWO83_2103 [Caulobacteraceae bacterium]|jgi:uncharacterized alpha-E superfamily protein|nr:hypothetical protein [Caulobacteraceae bacterium]
MMLARVADSLYWVGRYVERAEHLSRLSAVMLNATLDRTEAGAQAAQLARASIGDPESASLADPFDAARALVLDRERGGSVVLSLSGARENARQVRDQITTESWERLNLLYLRATGGRAERDFDADAPDFLQGIIADLHLFKGAADATMSHGEGWRFMLIGVHLERAQLIARLMRVCFSGAQGRVIDDHLALVSILRMACALEPYLRVYTADLHPRYILEFLLFDEEFPRSIRYSTARIEEHLTQLSKGREIGRGDPLRLAGRLNARLTYTDVEDVEATGASAILNSVEAECSAIHQAMYETFVAYPLETRLPA